MRIRNLFSRLSYKQKIYALIVLLLIILGPAIFSRITSKQDKPPEQVSEKETQPTLRERLSRDKNITFTDNVEHISFENDIIGIFPLVQGLYTVTNKKIVTHSQEGKAGEFPWDEEYGLGKLSAYMDDLGLIFIITDSGRVISFSPVSQKFSENSFSLPEKASVDFIDTYMTYMYVLSKDDGQIYRYPRGGNGFNSPMEWLQEKISLAQITGMAIDDNLYLTDGSSLSKLFKGQKEDFKLEDSATPVFFSDIFTSTDTPSLWVLDSNNARIIKYDKANGNILRQYQSDSIKSATSFSVDESAGKAYFRSDDGLEGIDVR